MAAAAYDVIDSGRDRASYLAARRLGIGASEIADVMGVGWGSPLAVFARKVGALPEEGENPVMRFGKRYEHLLAEDLEQLSGRRTVLDGRLLRSRRWPFLISTLDARQYSAPRMLYGAAEFKTTRFDWEADAENEPFGGVPETVYLQVQQQYAVTDAPRIVAAVFNRLSCLTVWAEVARDERYVEAIVEHAREFWRRVELGELSDPQGTEDCAAALRALYPEAKAGKVVALEGAWLERANELAQIKAERKALDARERQLKQDIHAALGDAESGVLPDGARFSARWIERAGYEVAPSRYRELRLVEPR